jgi:hypothetical protein
VSASSYACFVDAHVHIYPGYDLDRLMANAAANVAAGARALAVREPPLCYLLLSETASDNAFDRLRALAGQPRPGGWRVETTAEAEALRIEPAMGDPLIVVAGRQIRTDHGLEVLALATTAVFPDDRPLEESVARALDASPLVVLPWGFLKWTGRRGAMIETLLRGDVRLDVGDSRGRPASAREPRAFVVARQAGGRVLPGSDPLPLPQAERDVAGYGFVLRGPVELQTPAASLHGLLAAHAGDPPTYGRRVGALCMRDQLALRLRRPRQARSAALPVA